MSSRSRSRALARKAPARVEPAQAQAVSSEPAEGASEEDRIRWGELALGMAQARTAGAAAGPPEGPDGHSFAAPPEVARALARSTRSGTLGEAGIHTDEHAAAAARRLGAAAVTVGREIYFGHGAYAPGTAAGDRLLRHELAHVGQYTGERAFTSYTPLQVARESHPAERAAGAGAAGRYRTQRPVAFRHKVAPATVARLKRPDIFGSLVAPVVPGQTLSEFKEYTQKQADWFKETSLTAKDKDDLWALLLLINEGDHIRAGIGDVKVADLVGVAAADWPGLKAFCRGADAGGNTVRIHAVTTYTLADRIAHGKTLLELEALITAPVLHLTVSESQLKRVHATAGLMAELKTYWADYQPHLQSTYGYDPSAPGGKGPELEKMLDLLTTAGPAGMLALKPLAGVSPATRWVRNPHRFSLTALKQLVTNLGDTKGTRRLVLVLHTGHDAASFQIAAPLFDNLIDGSKATNNVLLIEGPTSLADVTARIPAIAAVWGKKTGWFGLGPRKISQVVIAGHGEARSVQMAGTGAPSVKAGAVEYGPIESLDLDANLVPTRNLLHALFKNMDPKTARLVYAGCLVGSTKVPMGTAPAAMPAFFAKESLGAWSEREGKGFGLPANFVKAARADVAMGSATGLFDPGTGDVGLQYAFDPSAFLGSAKDYAEKGREPTGVLRAAVELGTTGNTVLAETSLRTRAAMGALGGWYDDVTRAWVKIVLDGVAVGAGIDLRKTNDLANAGADVFLSRWPKLFGITVAHLTGRLNTLGFAGDVYTEVAKIGDFTAMPDNDTRRMRLILEQGWLALSGVPRRAPLMAAVLATGLAADGFSDLLDTAVLGPHGAALLPVGGVPTVEQARLGLAWFFKDPANADVRAFLTAQVATGTGAPPAFSAAIKAQIPTGKSESDILQDLGLITPTAPPSKPGAKPLPLANVQVPGSGKNTVLVEGKPYEAKVLPAVGAAGLPVRRGPGKAFGSFDKVKAGDVLRVQGFTHDWACIMHKGKLGFVFRGTVATPFIDPPPP